MVGSIKSVVIDFATAMPNKKGATNSAIPHKFSARRGGNAWDEITPATMLEESRKPFMKANINARIINTQSKIKHPLVKILARRISPSMINPDQSLIGNNARISIIIILNSFPF